MRNISGPVELTFHAEGSVTQAADGPSFTVRRMTSSGGAAVCAVVTYGRVVPASRRGRRAVRCRDSPW